MGILRRLWGPKQVTSMPCCVFKGRSLTDPGDLNSGLEGLFIYLFIYLFIFIASKSIDINIVVYTHSKINSHKKSYKIFYFKSRDCKVMYFNAGLYKALGT